MRIVQPQGSRGSLKWIQKLARNHPSALDDQLHRAGALSAGQSLTWLSPLAGDDYAEYRDKQFLRRIGQGQLADALSGFWPSRGPQWDGLATDGARRVFLVEAKAHAAEMGSTCQAGEVSRRKIEAACATAKQSLQCDPESDWLTGYYQYANRLAHLEFFRRHQVDAWLVFLYFTGDEDMNGPSDESEWIPHIGAAQRRLGLPAHPDGVVSVFQPVSRLG